MSENVFSFPISFNKCQSSICSKENFIFFVLNYSKFFNYLVWHYLLSSSFFFLIWPVGSLLWELDLFSQWHLGMTCNGHSFLWVCDLINWGGCHPLILLVWSQLEQALERRLLFGALHPWAELMDKGNCITGGVCFILYLWVCLFTEPLNKLVNRLLWVLTSEVLQSISCVLLNLHSSFFRRILFPILVSYSKPMWYYTARLQIKKLLSFTCTELKAGMWVINILIITKISHIWDPL